MITDITQLSPAWLTDVLNTPHNPVTRVEVTRSGTTNVSTVHHLQVIYTTPTTALPDRLFLKLVQVTTPEFFGKELTFYREIAPVVRARHPAFTALHCYAADYDVGLGHAFLLFEDVSGPYFGIDELDPTPDHHRHAVDGFAMLHATWWQHPRLGVDLGQGYTERWFDDAVQRINANYVGLVAEHPDLDPHWRDALSAVAARWPPRRRAQMLSGEALTIVHRDPHRRNFLYRRDDVPERRAIIIDWDAWRVDHGTVDLAYMMGFHWPSAQRAAQEQPLLAHYQHRLEQYGITGYTLEDCLLDYRISVVRCLLFMLSAWRPGRQPGQGWWSIVERGVNTYHDLNCAEVLNA